MMLDSDICLAYGVATRRKQCETDMDVSKNNVRCRRDSKNFISVENLEGSTCCAWTAAKTLLGSRKNMLDAYNNAEYCGLSGEDEK